jgi:hypothetical protein
MIHEEAHPDATIIWGAAFDPTLVDEIKVTIIATGFIDNAGKSNDGTTKKVASQAPVVPETPKIETKPQPVVEPVVEKELVVEEPVVEEPVTPTKPSLNDDLKKADDVLAFMNQYYDDFTFLTKSKK